MTKIPITAFFDRPPKRLEAERRKAKAKEMKARKKERELRAKTNIYHSDRAPTPVPEFFVTPVQDDRDEEDITGHTKLNHHVIKKKKRKKKQVHFDGKISSRSKQYHVVQKKATGTK